MKIYTEINYRWDGDELVMHTCESYEHGGEVAECKGGSQTVEASPLEVELAEISREKWDRYKNNYRPVEAKFRERVTEMGSDSNVAKAGSMASAELDLQLSGKRKNSIKNMTAQGIRPGGGRMLGLRNQLGSISASTKASASSGAKTGQKGRQIAGQLNAIGIGQGAATTAQESMQDNVKLSTQQARADAEFDWNSGVALAEGMAAATTLGGMYMKYGRDKKA